MTPSPPASSSAAGSTAPAGLRPPLRRGAWVGAPRRGKSTAPAGLGLDASMAFPLSAGELPASCEVAVVGAGIVGTAVAARLASAGVDVCLLERSGFAAGASSAGEGNLLLSDKLPGPELDFSVRSLQLWHRLVDRAGPFVELEEKGAVVVARDFSQMEELSSLARAHASAGVKVELLTGEELRELEPALSAEVAGGAYYPEDCQVQPMLAVAFQADELARSGGRAVAGVEVLGAGRHLPGARVTELVTSAGKICVGRFVVNAAGAWAGELARRLGDCVPVSPRKGQVLVTEPLANFLRHKVYEASYLGSVHAGEELSCAAVVESTPAGTVLIGSSRQSVGFAGEIDYAVAAELARRALALVPGLAGVRVMRAYVGFRPATPDRLPVIGPSTVVPNLVYATGHEGAGILLSQATAEVVASLVLGDELASSWQAFSAARFASETRAAALSEARAVAVAGGTGAQGEPGPGGADATLSGKSLASQVGRVAKVGDAKAAGMCRFSFDGRAFAAPVGSTVAGAILFNGLRAWRRTRQGGFPRGLFCGIGTCFDCLVDLNGHKAVRACLALLQDGDQVATSGSVGGGEGVPVGQSAPAGPHRRGSGGSCDVCVIGAGPAGLAAALAASRQGANVVVVDSGAREGGQFFRQPLAGESRLPDRLRALHRAPRVEVCLGEDVWSVSRTVGGFVVRTAGGGELTPRAWVLATGASEVVLPFPGWELHRVVAAGAAQSLLNAEGLRVGGRVVVAGTGPFLLPVAAALAGAGAQVTLVEAASPARAPAAAGALLAYPAKAKEAASYAKVLALARARVD